MSESFYAGLDRRLGAIVSGAEVGGVGGGAVGGVAGWILGPGAVVTATGVGIVGAIVGGVIGLNVSDRIQSSKEEGERLLRLMQDAGDNNARAAQASAEEARREMAM